MTGHLTSPVIVLSGPPGAGKTTIAREFAQHHDRAVHLHTDDFWHYIVAGLIAPYEAEAHRQNHTVLEVIAGAAYAYANGGFTTVVDGVVGPWMLDHFLRRASHEPNRPLHYIVLRPDRETALARARQRSAETALTEEAPILAMWDQFADLGDLERHVIDTSQHDLETSLGSVTTAVETRRFLLGPFE